MIVIQYNDIIATTFASNFVELILAKNGIRTFKWVMEMKTSQRRERESERDRQRDRETDRKRTM